MYIVRIERVGCVFFTIRRGPAENVPVKDLRFIEFFVPMQRIPKGFLCIMRYPRQTDCHTLYTVREQHDTEGSKDGNIQTAAGRYPLSAAVCNGYANHSFRFCLSLL